MSKRTRRVIENLLIALIFASTALLSSPLAASALAPRVEPNKVVLYMFWGDGCPHCAVAKPILEELAKKNPQLELRFYEVWYDDSNAALMDKMCESFGFKATAVPTIFIGDQYWVGYSDLIAEEITAKVAACSTNACKDAGVGVIPGVVEQPVVEPIDPTDPANGGFIQVPLIGKVDLNHQSLFVSTLLISFVDGFNPCSIWVLTMLLALTLHTGSRRKVIIIGLIFLTVTALIYALFIAGLFTILTFVSIVGWVQVVVALVALFFSIVNIKDYFWYKEGISLTISDEVKPGIAQRMRRLMDASQSFGGLVTGTVVLSAGVSLVEFSCTAGFPVLWTNLLSSQKVPAGVFIGLLIVYMIIYQLDELAIFFSAVYTLKASRLEEKQGRILKLIGGMLMLALAIVMLVKPSLMNNLGNSLLIFGAAFLATLLVLVLHRRILPAMGIYIGTEIGNRKRKGKAPRH